MEACRVVPKFVEASIKVVGCVGVTPYESMRKANATPRQNMPTYVIVDVGLKYWV